MVHNTPKHGGGMWQIYCHINIHVHLVGIFKEVTTKMRGMENFKIPGSGVGHRYE
jgi:hypothetical protein